MRVSYSQTQIPITNEKNMMPMMSVCKLASTSASASHGSSDQVPLNICQFGNLWRATGSIEITILLGFLLWGVKTRGRRNIWELRRFHLMSKWDHTQPGNDMYRPALSTLQYNVQKVFCSVCMLHMEQITILKTLWKSIWAFIWYPGYPAYYALVQWVDVLLITMLQEGQNSALIGTCVLLLWNVV